MGFICYCSLGRTSIIWRNKFNVPPSTVPGRYFPIVSRPFSADTQKQIIFFFCSVFNRVLGKTTWHYAVDFSVKVNISFPQIITPCVACDFVLQGRFGKFRPTTTRTKQCNFLVFFFFYSYRVSIITTVFFFFNIIRLSRHCFYRRRTIILNLGHDQLPWRQFRGNLQKYSRHQCAPWNSSNIPKPNRIV